MATSFLICHPKVRLIPVSSGTPRTFFSFHSPVGEAKLKSNKIFIVPGVPAIGSRSLPDDG